MRSLLASPWRAGHSRTLDPERRKFAKASLFDLAALWACAVAVVLSLGAIVVDGADGTIDQWVFIPIAICGGFAAVYFGRNGIRSGPTPGALILIAVIGAWLGLIAMSGVVYMLTGQFSRFDDALFESAAGFTTTHLTVIGDFDSAERSVLFWRAGTQWVGGFFAIAFGTIILPFWIGGREMSDPDGRDAGYRALAPTPRRGFENLVKYYGGFTLVSAAALWATGLSLFDGLTYAMTTVSTGGFGNHPGSLGFFDSAATEWVMAVIMLVAGSSVALVWWLLRGSGSVLRKSLEFRVYVFVAVVFTAFFALVEDEPGVSVFTAIRRGFVTTAAALSTTGHWVTDWSSWAAGPQSFFLMLIAVGSMAGSIGGGYRWLQVVEAFKFAQREYVIQLHPMARVAIKVGKRTATDRVIHQLNAQLSLVIATVGFGAVFLASFGSDLYTALSASVSAISTFGPAMGDMASRADATSFSPSARAVLMALMFAGRVSIYPIPLALGALLRTSRRRSHSARAAVGLARSDARLEVGEL